jgi:hypothetical protein
MKSLLLLLWFAMVPISASAEYYWCNGNKVLLEIKKEQSNVVTPTNGQFGRINQPFNRNASYIYKHGSDSMGISLTNIFNVKLKSVDDFHFLQQMASMYGAEILDEHILPNWYSLKCKEDCEFNALNLANLFYESGYFEESCPDFKGEIHLDCTNDPMFGSQWNLSHNGIFGNQYRNFDIDFCSAHTITSGSPNTIIAVYDSGMDLTHPDLNLFPLSYDVASDSSPSTIKDTHGTGCAGIIAAIGNNNIGITGIASSCPIMSITLPSVNPRDSTSGNRLAKGFQFAADNGCSVISCSWSVGIPPSPYLNNVILDVIKNGRNGLGSVVVFSAGNDNRSWPNYPASSIEDIVVVGAMSPCGERKSELSCDGGNWGSNYGEKLDVVAPGIFIPTTDLLDNTGYNYEFLGTSAACPHVSAIAGLILSVNPNLTSHQVINIIESTAQKIGNYEYTIHPNRTNGKWNNQMGYGLVNAYEAVLAAMPKYIQKHVFQSGEEIYEYATEIIAGHIVTNSVPYGDVVLESGSNVILRAMNQVVLKHGFHAKAGSELHIKVDNPTTQLISSPQQIALRTSFAPTNDTGSTTEEIANNGLETVANNMIYSTSIYTISGQLLQTIEGGLRDAAHLPNGMYILQHRMSDGSTRIEKIANNK